MPEHPCTKCDYIAGTAADLKKHLNRKNPCNTGNYHCNDCDKRFISRTGLWEHKQHNRCNGRLISRVQLEQKVDELTKTIKAMEVQAAKANLPDDIDETDSADVDDTAYAEADQLVSDNTIFVIKPDIKITTIGTTDVKRPQLYFYEAGPALIPLTPVNGIIFKFGESEKIYKRLTTHHHDHKGGRLVDSLLCLNAKAVELEFKRWMRLTGRLIQAKTSCKKSVDGEVFVVANQEEYSIIVNKAKELMREHEQEVSVQNDLVMELRAMRGEVLQLRASISTMDEEK